VISGRGRTAHWPLAAGTVTQVLSLTSVEVYFDDVAFGHEMSLEEIAPLLDFSYAQPVHPQRPFLGTVADEAMCAACGARDAGIHGCIKDKHGQKAVIPIDRGPVFPQRDPTGRLAVFCEESSAQHLSGEAAFSPAEGVLAFPQHPVLL
jgi:hypothetical protein